MTSLQLSQSDLQLSQSDNLVNPCNLVKKNTGTITCFILAKSIGRQGGAHILQAGTREDLGCSPRIGSVGQP